MISIKFEKRKCIKCKQVKDRKAFIGFREVCRVCWYYLSKDEKRELIIRNQQESKYYFNKLAWEQEKLLPKLRLNVKILE